MIPFLIPPLTGLHVLVTRPALQAISLAQQLMQLGAAVTRLPLLEIQPLVVAAPTQAYDLLIFISSNAVIHGQAILQAQPQARLAAVGSATARTLAELGHTIDITPQAAASSESLLAHPLLQSPPRQVLLVRGNGGRELLRDTLSARGSQVATIEVYARVPRQLDAAQLRDLQQLLQDDELDAISITSIELLHTLRDTLDPATLALAQRCNLLAGSARIAAEARRAGWSGECIVADSPEDSAMAAALAKWHTRARVR